MTSYTTCTNCAADKHVCSRRAQVRAAIKGAGITSVKFQCGDRLARFQPGQRVGVCWPVYDDADEMPTQEMWPATVMFEAGSRFVIQVDDVESDHGTPAREYLNNQTLFAKVPPSRLTVLDEPARRICSWCGSAPDPEASAQDCVDRFVWDRETGFCPPACILHPTASPERTGSSHSARGVEAGLGANRESRS